MNKRYIDILGCVFLGIVVLFISYQVYRSIDIERELIENPLYIDAIVTGYDSDANGNPTVIFVYNIKGVEYINTNYADCRYVVPKIGNKIVIKFSSKYPDCSRIENLSSSMKDCNEGNIPEWILKIFNAVGVKID
jgi:hypothetical protein